MDLTEVIGLTASALSSLTFMPQVYRAWKTKSVEDLSLVMMLFIFSSTILWLIYGYVRGALPVLICNGIILALSIVLIYFKFSFKKK